MTRNSMALWALLQDRAAAGRQLAAGALAGYRRKRDVLVLAIAPGGVPVADEIAEFLHAPLDVIAVCPLAMPDNGAATFGAIATGGARAIDADIVSALDLSDETIDAACAAGEADVARLTRSYRGDRLPPELVGQRVILVDEGVDALATMSAAIAAVRAQHPARLILAVPVARFDALRQLYDEVDEVVYLGTPYPFERIERWYWLFPKVTAETVRETLARHWAADDERTLRKAVDHRALRRIPRHPAHLTSVTGISTR